MLAFGNDAPIAGSSAHFQGHFPLWLPIDVTQKDQHVDA